MNKGQAQKEDGKAFEAFNIKIDKTYLNPKYTLIQSATTVMSSTGWLKIFELSRLDGGAPSFSGRWDGDSRDPGKEEKYDLDAIFTGFRMARSAASRTGRTATLGTTQKKL
jgi:hypothetical protein